jgi:hypothetical protein
VAYLLLLGANERQKCLFSEFLYVLMFMTYKNVFAPKLVESVS